MVRRNVSGIMIADKYENETLYSLTALEDCTDETRNEYLQGLEKAELIEICNKLCITLRSLGDQFDLKYDSKL